MFDFNVVPLSKQIWRKTWLLNFWAATGVPSLLNESCGTEPSQLNTLGSNLQARSSGTSYLSNTALAQTHRSSSMASSWLNFCWTKKNSKKWSQPRHCELENKCESYKRIHNMHWPGWWRHTELAQGHVAGSIISHFFFFSFFGSQKHEPATRHWARNGALSQLGGAEPATREWWICTVRDRWIFRCSLCSSNKSNYWLILAPYEINRRLVVYEYVYIYIAPTV